MLVLTRKPGERLMIGDHVTVTILDVGRGQVRIGVTAPQGVPVHRQEIYVKAAEGTLDEAAAGRDLPSAGKGTGKGKGNGKRS